MADKILEEVLEEVWQLLKEIMKANDIDVLWTAPNSTAFEDLIIIAGDAGRESKANEFRDRLESGKI